MWQMCHEKCYSSENKIFYKRTGNMIAVVGFSNIENSSQAPKDLGTPGWEQLVLYYLNLLNNLRVSN
jgi:hypothetical protein